MAKKLKILHSQNVKEMLPMYNVHKIGGEDEELCIPYFRSGGIEAMVPILDLAGLSVDPGLLSP